MNLLRRIRFHFMTHASVKYRLGPDDRFGLGQERGATQLWIRYAFNLSTAICLEFSFGIVAF